MLLEDLRLEVDCGTVDLEECRLTDSDLQRKFFLFDPISQWVGLCISGSLSKSVMAQN